MRIARRARPALVLVPLLAVGSAGSWRAAASAEARSAVATPAAVAPGTVTPAAVTASAVTPAGVMPASPSRPVTAPLAAAAVSAGRFVPVDPTRVVDTRDGTGVAGSKPTAGSVSTFTVAGQHGVPANVLAVVLNVTATDATAAGYVQVFPAGADVAGQSSNLNLETAGATVPNLVVVGIGTGGAVSIFTQSGTHLVVDLFGYFVPSGPSAAGRYVPLAGPRRTLDTRDTSAKLGPGGTYRLPLTTAAGGFLPPSATSVVMNVTATEATGAGFVQVVPTAGSTALGASSNLNLDRAGQTVPNLVIVPVGADGSVTFFSQRGTHLVVDVAGWFTGATDAVSSDGLFQPLSPARLLDTRDPALTPTVGPIAAGGSVAVRGVSGHGLPASGVAALVLNATVDHATDAGFVQAFPTGAATPGSSSTLNVERAGQTRANAAVTALGADGTFTVYTQRGGQLLADVSGWFSGTPAPVAAPTPVPPTSGVWKPALDTPWQWMISHALDVNNAKDMGLVDPTGKTLTTPVPVVYDIDWEYNSAATVAALHAMGKKVICYVDVGVFENYRPDAASFPTEIRGKADSHWQGSFWADVRRQDVLLPIMRARFQTCKDKGFDAIEPDEIDGYSNDSGFPLTYEDQLSYNRAIADLAHSMGLSIGQKGDIDQVKDLWQWFDWTLNEQCWEFSECGDLSTYYHGNGKAVFQVEYDDPFSGHIADPSTFCPQANTLDFNTMKMPLDLDGGRWPCR